MKKLYFFYKELKRRNVIKAGISYLVVSWVVLQVIALLADILNAPPWLGKTLLITLLILLPFWLIISWYYEITATGIARTKDIPSENSVSLETGQKLNFIIIGFLSVALVLLVVDRFRIGNTPSETDKNLMALATNEHSIVVLPFKDLSPEKDQEFFADGLAEELLNTLTHIPDLKVTSRTSAFFFKNQITDVPTIAAKLGVNYILEGSVRKADSLLRITIKLIDTKEDKGIWSNSWDRKVENIFAIQNNIAKAVASNLQFSLNDSIVNKATLADPDAYEKYLEAKFYHKKNSNYQVNLAKARQLIDESIAIDTSYAPAWATKSAIVGHQAGWGFIPSEKGYYISEIAAKKSIAIDPTFAQGYSELSRVFLERDWNTAKAQEYVDKALALAPNDGLVLSNASTIALVKGDLDTALRYNLLEIELDPLSVNSYYNLGITYYYRKQFKKAIAAMQASIALEPDQEYAHCFISLSYIELQDVENALKFANKEPDTSLRSHALAIIYWRQGDKVASQKQLDVLLNHPDGSAYEIASVYAFRNQNDKAFEWLTKLLVDPNYGLLELRFDSGFSNLHNDKRWDAFLEATKIKG